jgi:hypothetical protein
MITNKSSTRAVVTTGSEHVKLTNLHCQSRCQEKVDEDSKLEKGLMDAVVICKVWRLVIAL